MFGGLKISHLVSGSIAVLVGYTGSVAIIFQAIERLGATQAEANSWLMALGLGMGITTLILSVWFRMPILTAWSTPGAALLAGGTGALTLPEAVGAFLFCGALLTLTGVTGLFAKVSRLIPDALASAMLAGILFRFGMGIFPSLEENLWLVIVMVAIYLVGKRFFPRFAIPSVLLGGALYCWVSGAFLPGETLNLTIATPVFVAPEFSLPVLIGVGLPLYIVTMSSQNVPGVVALKSAGYEAPVSQAMTVTGLASLILSPFGGYAFNLAAITAAICTGPEADDDPTTRYKAGIVTGLVYCVVGLLGATVISLFLIAPNALVVTVAALALLATIGNGLSAGLSDPKGREAALVAFMTTVSGISFYDIGAPFWALIFGGIVQFTLNWRRDPT